MTVSQCFKDFYCSQTGLVKEQMQQALLNATSGLLAEQEAVAQSQLTALDAALAPLKAKHADVQGKIEHAQDLLASMPLVPTGCTELDAFISMVNTQLALARAIAPALEQQIAGLDALRALVFEQVTQAGTLAAQASAVVLPESC